MSYETGQATSVADLFSKLSTFATGTPGWTQNYTASDRLFLSKAGTDDTVYVAFWWDTSTPANVGIYQHNSFAGSGTNPGQSGHVDSGNGFTSTGSPSNTDFDDARYVPLDNDTNTYWFFEDDDYIHVIVETVGTGTKEYKHFGFGVLEKFDDWTGGAYAYGWRFDPAGGSNDIAVRGQSTHLLDAVSAGTDLENWVATVHCESLPGQPGAGKFGICWGSNASTGNDRQATPAAREQLVGGFRGGPIARPFGEWASGSEKGLVPLYPIWCFHREVTVGHVRPLGLMRDVRGINVQFFEGGDEIVIGSDTWVLFPSYRKQASAGSAYQGIAYRKVTT